MLCRLTRENNNNKFEMKAVSNKIYFLDALYIRNRTYGVYGLFVKQSHFPIMVIIPFQLQVLYLLFSDVCNVSDLKQTSHNITQPHCTCLISM
jgi:hypothetical protein